MPRFVSAVLDQIVILLIMFVIDIWALIFGIAIPGRMASIISLCIGFTYFEYYWTRRDGQTLGKRAMGLRVVAVDGGQITQGMAVGRYFGYSLNTLALGLGWLAVVFDEQHRGWHDRLGGTRVVMDAPRWHATNVNRTANTSSRFAEALRCVDARDYQKARTLFKTFDPDEAYRLNDYVDLLEHVERQRYHLAQALLRSMRTCDGENPAMMAQLEVIQSALDAGQYTDATAAIQRAIYDSHGEVPPAQTPTMEETPAVANEHDSDTHAYATPIVTYTLIAINVLIYLLTTGHNPYLWGANHHQLVLKSGEYYRLVSSMFLHANLEHVFFNMLALFMTGRLLERYIGWLHFLLIYFAGGLAGSVASTVINDNVASIGASGAVFAIFGAATVFYWRYRQQLDEKTGKQFRNAAGAVALNFANGIRPESGIDNWAHLGGLVGGIIVAATIYIYFTNHRREFQMLAGALIILTVVLGLTAIPVLHARTVSGGTITVRVPGGWHVLTDVESDPTCQGEDIHCLMVLLAPSGLSYEVDTFSGIFAVPPLAQVGQSLVSEYGKQGYGLVSSAEITIDSRDAIEQVYQVGQEFRMFAFAKEGKILLRLLIIGSSERLQNNQGEINAFIAGVHFRDESVSAAGGEVAANDTGEAGYSRFLGGYNFGRGDFERAVANFSQAIDLDPSHAIDYYYRGRAYAGQGHYDQAIADYDEAIRLDPGYTDAYNDRGNAYYAQGEYARAIADYDEAIHVDPRNANAYYNRGLAYHDQGDNAHAIADYDETIRLDPGYTDAYDDRGWAYIERGEYGRAAEDFDRAIELDPDYVHAYNGRGWTYYQLGKYSSAIVEYDRAIEIDPTISTIYHNRAMAYVQLYRYDQAISDYTHAIELDPTYAWSYNGRGWAYYQQGLYLNAIDDYDQAIEIDPTISTIYHNRAMAHAQLHHYNQAIADYTRAIELDPTYPWSYYNRGNIYYTRRQYDLALADLNEYVLLSGNDADPAATDLIDKIVAVEGSESVYQAALVRIQVAKDTGATKLDLSGLGLDELPPEIDQLTSLETLNLPGNDLTSLPPEIGQLTSLRTLNLGSNALTSLPPQIGQLTGLQLLSLSSNDLTGLPPEIGQLTNLHTLKLSFNDLTSLPPEIGQLANLRQLFLSGNKLTSLPPEIGQLTNLQQLDVAGNPLESPPPEVVKQGLDAIRTYLREQVDSSGGE